MTSSERSLHGPTLVLLPAACAGAALLATLVGAGGLVVGALLTAGWRDQPLPGFAAMKMDTALCFLLCGTALWRSRPRLEAPHRRLIAEAAAVLASLVAAVALIELAVSASLGLDGLFLRGLVWPGASGFRGRMSALTAVCFISLGVALLTLDRPRWLAMGQRFAVASGFIAFLNVVAYAYSLRVVTHPDSLRGYTDMAIATAVTLVVLSIGVTAARPGHGATGIFAQTTAGGHIARVLLPFAIVGPFLLGALRLAGQRAGYYGLEFGVAIMAVGNVVGFSLLVWWTAVGLHRADGRRRRAEAEVRRSNEELEVRVERRTAELAMSEHQYRQLIADSVVGLLIHRGGVVLLANDAAGGMLGYGSAQSLVGVAVTELIPPEIRTEVLSRVDARLRGEAVDAVVEFEVIRKDGDRMWVEAAASVVEWEGARSTLVALTDVGERRRREEAERQSAALATVAQLANATAHEINNPLTVISANLELLRMKTAERSDLLRHMERCQAAIRRISEMIAHMGHITRLEILDVEGGVPALDLRRSSEPYEG